MDSADCVFHADRFGFDALVRDLRKAHILNKACASVMAMAVCSCRKKAAFRQPISEQDVMAAADHVTSVSTDSWNRLSQSSHDLVECSTHTACRLPASSQARLIIVISQLLQGDVTLLEEERRASGHNISGFTHPAKKPSVPNSMSDTVLERKGIDDPASKSGTVSERKDNPESKPDAVPARKVTKHARRQKISMSAIHRIVNRKKRRCLVKSKFELPLFGGLTRRLFDLPEIGPNFSRLCVRHSCVVEIDGEATRRLMDANKQMTVVKVWCSSQVVLEAVKTELTALAVKMQSVTNTTWQRARLEKKIARQSYMCNQIPSSQKSFNIPDWKDILADDFEKKQTKQKVTGHGGKKAVKREDGSTYLGGHCLYCLMTLADFKAAGATGRCHHHSGFIVSFTEGDKERLEWTCCSQLSESSHPTHKDHADSGCQEGTHLWRPHKKASRGTRQKLCPHPDIRFPASKWAVDYHRYLFY